MTAYNSKQEAENQSSKDFYDEFFQSRMLNYRLYYGNPRINKAIKLISNSINYNSNILDIGCGIGIVPEQISKKLKNGYIWACDLSKNNIEYAKKTIKSNNIKFFSVDVLNNFSDLMSNVEKPVDVITMVDVIEHLPLSKHENFFRELKTVTTGETILVMTYPSPEYQYYLINNEPEELQVIDEIIEIDHLIQVVSQANFKLKYFSYPRTETKHKYIHAVFSQSLNFDPAVLTKKTLYEKVRGKLLFSFRKLIFPYLKYRYGQQEEEGLNDKDE